MALIRGNGGLDIRFLCSPPPKKHIIWAWVEPRVFGVFCVKKSTRTLDCSELQEPKKQKTNTFFGAQSHEKFNVTVIILTQLIMRNIGCITLLPVLS